MKKDMSSDSQTVVQRKREAQENKKKFETYKANEQHIENTSDNFAITSSELLSFDITLFGINFVAHALLSQKT